MFWRHGMKIIAATILTVMLTFAVMVVPEHFADCSSHDGCEICHLARHVSLPEPDASSNIGSSVGAEWFFAISSSASTLSAHVHIRFSRAPPLS